METPSEDAVEAWVTLLRKEGLCSLLQDSYCGYDARMHILTLGTKAAKRTTATSKTLTSWIGVVTAVVFATTRNIAACLVINRRAIALHDIRITSCCANDQAVLRVCSVHILKGVVSPTAGFDSTARAPVVEMMEEVEEYDHARHSKSDRNGNPGFEARAKTVLRRTAWLSRASVLDLVGDVICEWTSLTRSAPCVKPER